MAEEKRPKRGSLAFGRIQIKWTYTRAYSSPLDLDLANSTV
jgi:hypothetical protein